MAIVGPRVSIGLGILFLRIGAWLAEGPAADPTDPTGLMRGLGPGATLVDAVAPGLPGGAGHLAHVLELQTPPV